MNKISCIQICTLSYFILSEELVRDLRVMSWRVASRDRLILCIRGWQPSSVRDNRVNIQSLRATQSQSQLRNSAVTVQKQPQTVCQQMRVQ